MEVVKRDGRREAFDKEKIVRSCVGCGAPEDVAAKVASEIETEAKDGMPTSEIKEMVLRKLDAESPQCRSSWEEHEKTKAAGT